MSDSQPVLEFREAQPCLSIPISVTVAEWGQALACIPEIGAWLGAHGIDPAGPLFFRYAVIGNMKDEPFDLEIGFPVASVVEGDDRVRAGEIPAGIYVTSIHSGHPDGLVGTCAALLAWGEREGVRFASHPRDGREAWTGRYEFYLSDPDDVPDMNDWQTEVAFLTHGGNGENKS